MLGLDVSRHNPIADWKKIKDAGVGYCWVKGTDGLGPAPVQDGSTRVAACKRVGIPVGLYGYAQMGDPRKQASVLWDEVNDLDADQLMCALDLEDPHTPGTAARNFAIAYLQRLKELGVSRPVLYANTSMLRGIDSNSIRTIVPGTIIWCANYGANNGQMNTAQFRTATKGLHVDIWQYTSAGRLPGYNGNLDLNWAFTNAHFTNTNVVPEDDMQIAESFYHDGRFRTVGEALGSSQDNSAITRAQTLLILDAVTGKEITPEVIAQKVGEELDKRAGVDMEAIKTAVRETLGEDNEDQAAEIVAAIGRQLSAQG